MTEHNTRDRILRIATTLFYQEGIRKVGIQMICVKAGISKPTLYHHFANKDALITAYLEGMDGQTYGTMRKVVEHTSGALTDKITALFEMIAGSAKNEKWKGCPFMRGASEFADDGLHPAQTTSRDHKKRLEVWLADLLFKHDIEYPEETARQLMVLLDGAVMTVFLHRDADYARQSAAVARLLLENRRT